MRRALTLFEVIFFGGGLIAAFAGFVYFASAESPYLKFSGGCIGCTAFTIPYIAFLATLERMFIARPDLPPCRNGTCESKH